MLLRAAINAAENVFENVEVRGCFFYLSFNIWKRIQANGLQEGYMDDAEFALHMRMIAALAFVPPQDVITFPIETWNMFHRTHQEIPRTNNHIEGIEGLKAT